MRFYEPILGGVQYRHIFGSQKNTVLLAWDQQEIGMASINMANLK